MKHLKLFEEFLNENALMPLENFSFEKLKNMCEELINGLMIEEIERRKSQHLNNPNKKFSEFDGAYSFETKIENINFIIRIDNNEQPLIKELGIIGGVYYSHKQQIELLVTKDFFNLFQTRKKELLFGLITIVGHELIHSRQKSNQITDKINRNFWKNFNKLYNYQSRLSSSKEIRIIEIEKQILYIGSAKEIPAWAWSCVTGLLFFIGKEKTKEIISRGIINIHKIQIDSNDIEKFFILLFKRVIFILNQDKNKEKLNKFRKYCYEYYDVLT